MIIYTEREAKSAKLIRLTRWLHKTELPWLRSEYERINANPTRTVALVKSTLCSYDYALYVNDVRHLHFSDL